MRLLVAERRVGGLRALRKGPKVNLVCWLGSFGVREHTVNVRARSRLDAGPVRYEEERQYGSNVRGSDKDPTRGPNARES